MDCKKHKKDAVRVGARRSLNEDLQEAVSLGMPAVICGSTGKTLLLTDFHSGFFKDNAHGRQLAVLDSREFSDMKMLGGFYAIKDGDIQYMRGVLAESMLNGGWILFKRIDRNHGLLQYLYTVIKYGRLLRSDGCEVVASKDFRLFFTSHEELHVDGAMLVGPLEFGFGDAMEIFGLSVRKTLLRIFDDIGKKTSGRCLREKGGECMESCIKDTPSCGDEETWCLSPGRVLCSMHFRALLRTRKRIGDVDALTVESRTRIYNSVANVFLKHDSEPLRHSLVLAEAPGISLHGMELARTEAVEWGITNILMNVRHGEYTLLVGETGAGKTAMVQYLSAKSHFFLGIHTTLRVVNMSSDFDGADLVGGYRTLNMDRSIKELCNRLGVEVPVSYGNKEKLLFLHGAVSGRIRCEREADEMKKEIELLMRLLGGQTHFVYKEGILTESMMSGGWLLLDEINLCSEETLDLIEALVSRKEIFLYESGKLEPLRIHPEFMLFACMNPSGDFGKKKYNSAEFGIVHIHDFSAFLKDIRLVIHAVLKYGVEEKKKERIGEFFWELKKRILKKELSNISEPLVSGRSLVRVLKLVEKKKDRDLDEVIYDAFDLFVFTQFNLISRSVASALFSKYFAIPLRTTKKTETRLGFVLTPRVQMHLSIIRAAVESNYPLLLQGDTSTGKTSTVFFLAGESGSNVVRINNHEHTEASDYIGNFCSTENGIEFREGTLITAMRRGDWVILDELNLAPSDVLEVLNRLLDDNRQIYVPELDEVVEPHPRFRIFATQNMAYGGRKGLSRAFRNRFVEVFFHENDENEILEILHGVSKLPMSFCRKMVAVYSNLRSRRTINTLITLRDLFKWSNRAPTTVEEVYVAGMNIIYERQRVEDDRRCVSGVFEEVFEGQRTECYVQRMAQSAAGVDGDMDDVNIGDASVIVERLYIGDFVFTDSFKRLVNLMVSAWKNREPILIIGETGIGKTKMCDIVSSAFRTKLTTLSMHRGIESSDFIGNFVFENSEVVWRDGPLVKAMRNGEAFLIDEINLAEDSVLERLNSLLEFQRTLYITETGEEVAAHQRFRILATMNPGDDFGKRELSPALRNRFTEIYFDISASELPLIFDRLLDEQLGMAPEAAEFKRMSRVLDVSIRKLELAVDFIHRRYRSSFGEVVCKGAFDAVEVWSEVLEIVRARVPEYCKTNYCEDGNVFGVHPYFVPCRSASSFCFAAPTSAMNLRQILRAMGLGKGVMLEGDPGIGKTSIVQGIARKMGKKCLRINLSEHTELCDLVGAYLPINGEIRFVESELVQSLKEGSWIVLDEINLCTQSVIEGLNSVLDYRRKLFIPEVVVDVHKDTRIFATLNPFNSKNGRKILPKSFLDRFVRIEMSSYTFDDMQYILNSMFASPTMMSSLSLRENIRINQIGQYFVKREVDYLVDAEAIRVGSVKICRSIREHASGFVLIHSQIQQVETVLKCMSSGIPVVLSGEIGKDALIQFLSLVFGQDVVLFNCCKDTDSCDLLGQYQKAESGSFEWRDSAVIDGVRRGKMIVFVGPEIVEKSAFDRLSSLFESERMLNIYEKGIDIAVDVHPSTKMLLVSREPSMLSPALLDRCIRIELESELDYFDLWKMFMRRNAGGVVSYKDFCGMSLEKKPRNISLELRRFEMLGIHPFFLDRPLRGIYNALEESEIDRMFSFEERHVDVSEADEGLLRFYKKINMQAGGLGSDEDRVERLKSLAVKDNVSEALKAVTFIKSAGLSILDAFGRQGMCSLNFPKTIKDLKHKAIESLRSKKFADYRHLKRIFNRLAEVSWTFSLDFDDTFFNFIERCHRDPLDMLKADTEKKMFDFENKMLSRIYSTMKSVYKYGRGSIEPMVEEYERGMERYRRSIGDIERKMQRDYAGLRKSLCSLDFCSYVLGDSAYYEQFSDVFDYYLIYLFRKWTQGQGCSGRCKIWRASEDGGNQDIVRGREQPSLEYRSADVFHGGRNGEETVPYSLLCLNLMKLQLGIIPHLGEIDCKSLKHGFARHLHLLYYSGQVDDVNLMLECIVFDEHVHVGDGDWIDGLLEFCESGLDACLRSAFNFRGKAQVIESRTHVLAVTEDLVDMMDEETLKLSIFTSVGDLTAHVEQKISEFRESVLVEDAYTSHVVDGVQDADCGTLESTIVIPSSKKARVCDVSPWDSLMNGLSRLYKCSSVCDLDRNYRYFLYMLITPFTPATAERFFLDCSVHEFADRMECARELSMKTRDPAVYNLTLKYAAFEVDRLCRDRVRDAKSKLRKEPRLYKGTLEDLRTFLILPVTNVLNLKFTQPSPVCQDIHPDRHTYMLKERSECECQDWIDLSKKFNRQEIQRMLSARKIDKKTVVDSFCSRIPDALFSESEICLGKVINQVIDNPALLSLTGMCIEEPYIPFMYFVFSFAHEQEEVEEDGTGMKSGTGNVNISEEIKHEDEIDDDYGEQEKVEEEDGINFDNQGSVSTVSDGEQDDCESAADASSENEEEEEEQSRSTADEEQMNLDEGLGEEGNDSGMEIEEENKEDSMEEESGSKSKEESGEEESGSSTVDSQIDEASNLNEYQFREGNLNQSQACDVADNYERHVFGANTEDQAVCAGEGDEEIGGNDEDGDGNPVESTVRIRMEDPDCTRLTNLLRVVMQSNRNNKYRGDFKSGKKLNMKKLVPYIASGYRRDRIWMKRQKSDRKEYTLRLFVDNSRSMYSQEMIDTLLSVYSKISRSFSLLGIPIEVYRFGRTLERCPIEEMTFGDSQTVISWIDEFTDGINIILTDGVFQNVGFHNPSFLVLLIDKCDVRKMSKVTVSEGSVFVQKYLDTFPLKYCIVANVNELESAFVMALSEIIEHSS